MYGYRLCRPVGLVLGRLRRIDRFVQPDGGLNVLNWNLEYVCAGLLCAALLVYLVLALLHAEEW